jgi:hypothetical protein
MDARPLLVVALLALSGCAGDSGDVTDPTEPAPARSLEITVSSGSAADATTWTLTCDPAGGSHPTPEAACGVLDAAADPFAPVPADMGCTQIYGGPETATITGTWDGESVAAKYNRTDGCEIARWEALAAVLAPAGLGSAS